MIITSWPAKINLFEREFKFIISWLQSFWQERFYLFNKQFCIFTTFRKMAL